MKEATFGELTGALRKSIVLQVMSSRQRSAGPALAVMAHWGGARARQAACVSQDESLHVTRHYTGIHQDAHQYGNGREHKQQTGRRN